MSAVIVTLLILAGVVYTALVIHWWPVLDDSEHFVREKMQEEDNFRFFAALPRPDREWNR